MSFSKTFPKKSKAAAAKKKDYFFFSEEPEILNRTYKAFDDILKIRQKLIEDFSFLSYFRLTDDELTRLHQRDIRQHFERDADRELKLFDRFLLQDLIFLVSKHKAKTEDEFVCRQETLLLEYRRLLNIVILGLKDIDSVTNSAELFLFCRRLLKSSVDEVSFDHVYDGIDMAMQLLTFSDKRAFKFIADRMKAVGSKISRDTETDQRKLILCSCHENSSNNFNGLTDIEYIQKMRLDCRELPQRQKLSTSTDLVGLSSLFFLLRESLESLTDDEDHERFIQTQLLLEEFDEDILPSVNGLSDDLAGIEEINDRFHNATESLGDLTERHRELMTFHLKRNPSIKKHFLEVLL